MLKWGRHQVPTQRGQMGSDDNKGFERRGESRTIMIESGISSLSYWSCPVLSIIIVAAVE
jgi:hypothetical protein